MVGPEGMEKFCEDIGVEPENVSAYLKSFIFRHLFISLAFSLMTSFWQW